LLPFHAAVENALGLAAIRDLQLGSTSAQTPSSGITAGAPAVKRTPDLDGATAASDACKADISARDAHSALSDCSRSVTLFEAIHDRANSAQAPCKHLAHSAHRQESWSERDCTCGLDAIGARLPNGCRRWQPLTTVLDQVPSRKPYCWRFFVRLRPTVTVLEPIRFPLALPRDARFYKGFRDPDCSCCY
jgi:hypothetical protein